VSPSVLRLAGVDVTLAGRPALRGVDLDVAQGEVVALLGANGSGKSTLVRTLVGVLTPDRGAVELFGVPRSRFRDWARIGYVPQRTSAAAGVPATVAEVVASGRLSRRRRFARATPADHSAVEQALAVVGLTDRRADSVTRLSGGQQQRVLIARALAGEPDVLILDEATAGVDLPSQLALATALEQLAASGRTVLLAAHELGPLERLVRRAVTLQAGRIAYDGPPPAGTGYHAEPEHHLEPALSEAAVWRLG